MQHQMRYFSDSYASVFLICKSERRLKGILQRCFQGVFYHCLENHLAKMSKNSLCEMSYIPLYQMSFRQLCKIFSTFANPTSFRRLKDILPRCLECLHKIQVLFFSCFLLELTKYLFWEQGFLHQGIVQLIFEIFLRLS